MDTLKDPFELIVREDHGDTFDVLSRRPVVSAVHEPRPAPAAVPAALTARLSGFGLDERPLITGLPGLPGEVVPARGAVPLLRSHVGSDVVVVCADGDVRRPIVIGVLDDSRPARLEGHVPASTVSIQADGARVVVSAEREIVLRCGEASITLTRAGKVLIKGTYVLSRSSGYNKIKGAAVDIN
jgi:hypothetical protein